jgi:hypothetical protein
LQAVAAQKAAEQAARDKAARDKAAAAIVNEVPVVAEEAVSTDKTNDVVVVKRGKHMLEVPVGHYVIVGSFGVMKNAEVYSDKLFKLGYHDVSFGYLSEKGLYQVWISKVKDPSTARKERDKFRQKSMFKDAWYLLVEE